MSTDDVTRLQVGERVLSRAQVRELGVQIQADQNRQNRPKPLRAALTVATASRYLLGAVAGCAAPLVCRVVGHQLRPAGWSGAVGVEQCGRCGEEWLVGTR